LKIASYKIASNMIQGLLVIKKQIETPVTLNIKVVHMT